MRVGIFRNGANHSGVWEWRDAETGEVRCAVAYRVDASSDSRSAALRYRLVSTNETLAYNVPLLTTRPNYGGVKWWFGCPACRRRVRKLYLPPGHKYFVCRRCYRLAYELQRKDAQGRAIAKARKVRSRLGGSPSLLDRFPSPPKGMWSRTYLRLRAEAYAAEGRAIGLTQRWMDRMRKQGSEGLLQ